MTGDGVDSFGYDTENHSFVYDTENHLLSASALGNTIAYTYDPLGRRAAKTVNSTVTAYVDAGDQEIAEYDGSGTLLARYVYGADASAPVATVTVSGSSSTTAFDHKDGLGSIVALSDGATGDMTDSYAYDPYGESASLTGNAFRFAGMRLDAESGLYYDRARYYAPALGRFLQTDPIGTNGGINLYAYVGNDPIDLVDPSGLAAEQGLTQYANAEITNAQAQTQFAADHPYISAAIAAAPVAIAGCMALCGEAAGGSAIVAGGTSVYQAVDTSGSVVYVGITDSLEARAAAHSGRFAIQAIEGLTGIARSQARAIEQTLIEDIGRVNKGTGTLLNKINSIARSNPIYNDAVSTGRAILKEIGYPGY